MTSASLRRRVGQTALSLPALGFGGAHLGERFGPVDEEVSQATLQSAWAASVRHYDTAPFYGRGLSEHRIGGFLRTKRRDEFTISTKVGRVLRRPPDPPSFDRSPWVGGLHFDFDFDYTYDGFMRSYEQSLQRLALDTVDALVIHDLDEGFHDPRTLESYTRQLLDSGIKALEQLKRSGDIKAIGIGINTDAALNETAPRIPVDFCLVAMPYTLLDQASLHLGMARCLRDGVSVVIGSPFASGILATGSRVDAPQYAYSRATPDIKERVRRLESACSVHGVPLIAAALQFVLAHPAVVSVVPGAARPTEIEENAAALQTHIPPAFWGTLKAEGLVDETAPVPETSVP